MSAAALLHSRRVDGADTLRGRWPVRVGLVLGAVHLFGLLQNSPLQPYVWRYDFIITLGLCAFAGVYGALRLVNRGLRISPVGACIVLVVAVIPFYSAWRASVVFGQPLLYGVLAQRNLLMALYGFGLMAALRGRLVGQEDVRRVLVGLCWASLGAFYLVAAARLAGWEPAPLLEDSEIRFGRNNFNVILMAFGVCYYVVDYARTARLRAALAVGVLLFSIVVVREARGITAALAVALVLYLLGGTSWRQKRRFLRLLSGALAVAVLVLVLVPGLALRVADLGALFGDAVSVVTGGGSTDVSAGVRVVQFLKALPYVQEHLWLGNGLLSAQWQGGFERLLGYFHPSDLGIVGVVFLYGVAGSALFGVQIGLAISLGRRLDRRAASTFTLALHVFLLYLYALSIFTGLVFFTAGISLVVLVLLADGVQRPRTAGPIDLQAHLSV